MFGDGTAVAAAAAAAMIALYVSLPRAMNEWQIVTKYVRLYMYDVISHVAKEYKAKNNVYSFIYITMRKQQPPMCLFLS